MIATEVATLLVLFILAGFIWLLNSRRNDDDDYDVPPVITPGTYQHYKGDLYSVLAVAKHTEKNRYFVIYESQKDGKVYASTIRRWLGHVKHHGQLVPRFKEYLGGKL